MPTAVRLQIHKEINERMVVIAISIEISNLGVLHRAKCDQGLASWDKGWQAYCAKIQARAAMGEGPLVDTAVDEFVKAYLSSTDFTTWPLKDDGGLSKWERIVSQFGSLSPLVISLADILPTNRSLVASVPVTLLPGRYWEAVAQRQHRDPRLLRWFTIYQCLGYGSEDGDLRQLTSTELGSCPNSGQDLLTRESWHVLQDLGQLPVQSSPHWAMQRSYVGGDAQTVHDLVRPNILEYAAAPQIPTDPSIAIAGASHVSSPFRSRREKTMHRTEPYTRSSREMTRGLPSSQPRIGGPTALSARRGKESDVNSTEPPGPLNRPSPVGINAAYDSSYVEAADVDRGNCSIAVAEPQGRPWTLAQSSSNGGHGRDWTRPQMSSSVAPNTSSLDVIDLTDSPEIQPASLPALAENMLQPGTSLQHHGKLIAPQGGAQVSPTSRKTYGELARNFLRQAGDWKSVHQILEGVRPDLKENTTDYKRGTTWLKTALKHPDFIKKEKGARDLYKLRDEVTRVSCAEEGFTFIQGPLFQSPNCGAQLHMAHDAFGTQIAASQNAVQETYSSSLPLRPAFDRRIQTSEAQPPQWSWKPPPHQGQL